MMSNLDDIKNIDESTSDIYSIQEYQVPETYEKTYRQTSQANLDEIVTISSQPVTLQIPKLEEPKVKRTNETNGSNKLLLVPPDGKPMHKLYGSTKHLFQKQLSMEVYEETPFLLTVPGKRPEEETKLPKHDSQESVQRIITERRKLDENLKEINQYDIFEVTRNDSEERLVEQEKEKSSSSKNDDRC